VSAVKYHDPDSGVVVGTYAGPANSLNAPRGRVQITTRDAELSLSREEWDSLLEACLSIDDIWEAPEVDE
jgi:hypothetical protein